MTARAILKPVDERQLSRINMRVPTQTKALIDQAATIVGQTLTEFILNSARQKAEDVLLDQRLFNLPKKDFDAFQKLLDSPPEPTAALKQLLAAKSPWEK